MSSDRKYPIERTEYCKNVGRTRVENTAQILRDLGFTVTIGEPENGDVDMWVLKEGNLVLVVEVLNWRSQVYVDYKRVKSIIKNFSNPRYNDSKKLLVFSFMKNIENQMDYFKKLGIDFLEIGFQTQPTGYYHFFSIHGRANDMKPDDHATRQIEKGKLLTYLKERNLT